MFRTLCLLAAVSLLPGGALAQKPVASKKTAAKPAAKPAKKAATAPKLAAILLEDRAEQDGFGVRQVSAPDARQFVGAWALGTASKATATTTVADKPLFVFIVFHGCKAGEDGKCDVTADFAIHRPDGSIDDDHKDMAIWKRAPADDAKKSVLGDGALGFGTDSEGPFGDYRIVATVTDKVAGITLKTAQILTVAPPGEAPVAAAVPAAAAPPTEAALPLPEPTPSATPTGKPRGR